MVNGRKGMVVKATPIAPLKAKGEVALSGLYDFLARHAEGLQGPDRIAFRENLGRFRRREVSND